MKYTKEFAVGIVAILAIGLLYWGTSFLKGEDIFSTHTKFFAIYPKVDGLTKSQPVIISGFTVGSIANMYFHPKMDGSVVVEMKIHTEYPLSTNTVARITSTDLLGGKAIELVPGDNRQPAQSGDTLMSEVSLSLTEEMNMQVLPLKNKIEKLLGSVDTILVLTSEIFTDNFKDNIETSVNSLKNTFASLESSAKAFDHLLADNEESLTRTIEDVGEVSHVLQQNKHNLDKIAKNLAAVSDSLIQSNPGEAFRSLTSTIVNFNDLLQRVEQGEGNLGLLLNDEDLFNNLELASQRLNLLLLDMQLNPKRYVGVSIFGRAKEFNAEELHQLDKEDREKRKKLKNK
ncbi:MAG: MCE family protein [Cryomorphaceae bacterium]|nr:MCE family protein [Cryomorphaceae bacterium]